MLERLERGHRQAVRFTADASHELKTPLALIAAGLEELLRRRDLAPEVVTALGSLLEDNRRLAAVCQDLLVLSRADAGRLALDRQPHDLRALVEAAVEDARILGEERAITFEIELPTQAGEFVDARYLTRILLNLLSNAVKYNHDRGCVRLELTKEAEQWSLTIGNTGPGIAAEHQGRLFERFFRADYSDATHGHGLGLSLSRELARAHGGELVLLGSDAKWTIFRLTLPRTVFEPPVFAVPERASPVTSHQS
jgi:two-component system, OmpR family, heavy metal sensor histidine kinase CusS